LFQTFKSLSTFIFPLKFFLRSLKNGRHLFVDQTNLLRAAILPLRRCTSFTFVGGDISIIALTLSGFASILLCDIIKPRNFPYGTTNIHLDGFSFMLYFQRVLKVSSKFAKWFTVCRLLTNLSSTYTSAFRPI